jgi:hypothetical protein
MSAGDIFVTLGVICAACGATAAILITASLDRRGLPTPFPLIGFYALRNVARYRKLTAEESGRPGPLFTVYVGSMAAALVLVVLGMILRAR